MTLLGLVGGAAFGLVALRPAYESQARVLVRPISADTARVPEPIGAAAMATERELVSADGVVMLAQRRTGWRRRPDLRRPLGVSLEGGTQNHRHHLPGGHPDRARLGAQAFAESYLAYRAGLAAATREGARRNLEAALRDVSARMRGGATSRRPRPAPKPSATRWPRKRPRTRPGWPRWPPSPRTPPAPWFAGRAPVVTLGCRPAAAAVSVRCSVSSRLSSTVSAGRRPAPAGER